MILVSLMRVRISTLNCEERRANDYPDSLAGQMNALKTGGLSAPPKKKKKLVEESSDEESNTEGEEADDTSETDTDTDEE
jgi:translocation protein SEC63